VYCQVVILFSHCIHAFPSFISNFIDLSVLSAITSCLAYINVCVNPFIYAIISPPFRKYFGRLFLCPVGWPSTQSGRGDVAEPSVVAQEQTVKYRPDKGAVDFQRDAE